MSEEGWGGGGSGVSLAEKSERSVIALEVLNSDLQPHSRADATMVKM